MKTAEEKFIEEVDKLLPNKFALQLLIVQHAKRFADKQSQEYLKWWQSSVMAGDQSTDQELLTRYHESQKI